MSAPTAAPPRPEVARPEVPGASRLPQVNLLPPEVRAGRRLSNLKSWLGVGLLVTILVAGLAFVWAALVARQAENELVAAQERTAELVREQAQYAEVPIVLNELSSVTEARAQGMATEVLWRPYLAAIAATAPTGVSLTNITVATVGPLTGTVAPSSNPLVQANVGTVTFEARSLTLPETKVWLEQLRDVPGLSNPWFSTASVAELNGVVHYTVGGTVDITDSAYALRFAEQPAPDAAAAEGND